MNKLLHSGWAAGIAFIGGTLIMGTLLKEYNVVSQTVSEIGQKGSALELEFQIFSFAISILLILFSSALILFSKRQGLSVVPAVFLLTFGLAEFGIGAFASPHPLHNVFGLSSTIGYFSPLMFFLLWKKKLGLRFKWISLLVFVLVIIGIFLNLTPAFAPELYPLKYYGLVQRFLLYSFFGYCAYVSIVALESTEKADL
ncbi:MAG: DUF998 domain-containing protein [Flavobacteriaceae bacterium]